MIDHMYKDIIELPPKGRLEICIYPTGHYSYKYLESRKGSWIKLKRWEWHADHGKPHVHHHDESGFCVKTEKSKEYALESVLAEIKKEFNKDIDMQALAKIIQDRN